MAVEHKFHTNSTACNSGVYVSRQLLMDRHLRCLNTVPKLVWQLNQASRAMNISERSHKQLFTKIKQYIKYVGLVYDSNDFMFGTLSEKRFLVSSVSAFIDRSNQGLVASLLLGASLTPSTFYYKIFITKN